MEETSPKDSSIDGERKDRLVDDSVIETSDKSLRTLSVYMLILVIIQLGVGTWLDGSPRSYIPLSVHTVVAIAMIGLAGYTILASLKLPGWHRRMLSVINFVSSIIATVAGIEFALGGFSDLGQVNIMGDFAGVLLLGTILLFAWGSVKTDTKTNPSTY